MRVSVFGVFFSNMNTCIAALEQELLVGDGWMDGSSEEEEEVCKRMDRDFVHVCVCVFECVRQDAV